MFCSVVSLQKTFLGLYLFFVLGLQMLRKAVFFPQRETFYLMFVKAPNVVVEESGMVISGL